MSPPILDWIRANAARLIILAAIALAGGGTVALVIDSDGDGPNPPVTNPIELKAKDGQVVKVPGGAIVNPSGPVPSVTVDSDQTIDRQEQKDERSSAGQEPDLHEDQRDETPPGISKAEVQAGKAKAAEVNKDVMRKPVEPAGAQAYDCRNAYVVNKSALSGRRYGVALHFTVSNPGSLDAIRGLFNRPSFGASSNLGFELFNLRCQWWVPFNLKAWAQGAFNSAYVSIEIITNDRSRASWLASPAIRRGILAALVADLLKKSGAPPTLRDPVACTPLAGVVDHDRLECGNSHWDVGKNFPWDVFMPQVRRAYNGASAAASPRRVQSKPERRITDRRCYHWRKYHQTTGAAKATQLRHSKTWKTAAGRQKRRLDAAHARGQSWKDDSIGSRRKVMARTERLAKSDRRVLCR